MNAQYPPAVNHFDGVTLNRKLVLGALLLMFLLMLPMAASAAPPLQEENCTVADGEVTDLCSDLGDAPDSSNHFGVGMDAYLFNGNPVPADFPTVFDPTTGQPQGPSHNDPTQIYLGSGVSLEADADLRPDQDQFKNIRPYTNTSDWDEMDDSTQVNQWYLPHCQSATVMVQVTVTPAAYNAWAPNNTEFYLNGWIDGNRNGTWADVVPCQQANLGQFFDAYEHAIIDWPINIAALGGPGTYNLAINTSRVSWPAGLQQRPAWVRLTLSETKSNKPFVNGNVEYGDGRGFEDMFKYGETEDHVINSPANLGYDPSCYVPGDPGCGPGGNQGDPPFAQAAGLNKQPFAQETQNNILFLPIVHP